MDTPASDTEIEGLDDQSLRVRLARNDWKNDTLFLSNEQIFRMFCRARMGGDKGQRVGLLANALSRRLVALAKGFSVRSKIYPGIYSNLDEVAEELSQFVWECLIKRPKDAAHAEKYFGQLFARRAIDFQKRLLAKKRSKQESLDAMDWSDDDDDPERTIRVITALRQDANPADAIATQQEHAKVAAQLQALLTKREHYVYTMIYVEDMAIKDIAAALKVTPRTINTYKNSALEKVRKEFTQ